MSTTIESQPQRVKVSGYESPLSSSTLRGKSALVVGGGLALIVAFLCWAAWGELPYGVEPPNVPPIVFTAIAVGVFGLPGLYLLATGLRDVLTDRRNAELRALHPTEPWRYDYRWNETESTDLGLRGVGRSLLGCVLVAGILFPFHYLAFAERLPIFAFVFIGLFDLLVSLAFGVLAYRVLAEVVHGRSRLRFGAFPFRLGETARLELLPTGRLDDVQSLRCTLRCVEEQCEAVESYNPGPGAKRTRTVILVGFERYAAQQVVEGDATQGGGGIELAFDLPNDPELETRLADRNAIYWELDVEGERPGINYHKRFLVPVY
ncbi:MAG: hypothetical protein RIC55_28345 [Pirellulaceae bacterium]